MADQKRSYTRLSDFGAFRIDITKVDTQELSIVQLDSNSDKTIAHPFFDSVQQATGMMREGKIISFPGSGDTPIPQRALLDGAVMPFYQEKLEPVSLDKKKRSKWLSVLLRVGVTFLLFAFLLKSMSWPSLIGALAQADIGKVLLSFIVGVFGIVVSAYQWRSLLNAEGIKYDLADLIDLYLVGIAFSHFLPTGMGGDVVKAVQVGRTSGNSAGSASAVLLSRITGFLGMILMALPVLLIWHHSLAQSIFLWFILLSLLVGAMLGGAIAFTTLFPKIYKGKFLNHRIFASVTKIGYALQHAFQRPKVMAIAIVFGIEFWAVGCLNYYGYGIALGLNVPLYFYFIAIPLISLVTFLPISINGFGVREGAFVFIFATIHISSAHALLLALLMDAQVLLFGVMGGIIYLAMGNKHKSNKEKVARAKSHIA